jgi:hypothetical protein
MLVDLRALVNQAELLFGTLNEMDIRTVKARLMLPFTDASKFEAEAASKSQDIATLAGAKWAMSENDQMDLIKVCAAHNPVLSSLIQRFQETTTSEANRTRVKMVSYVTTNIPYVPISMITTGHAYSTHTMAATVATAHSKSDLKFTQDDLDAAVKAALAARHPASTKKPLYCFEHGTGASHTSIGCNYMRNDPTFTMAMRQATHKCTIGAKTGKD